MKIRDVLKRLRDEGWILDRQKGSHQQFIHPGKPGLRVTVAGHPKLECQKERLIVYSSKLAGNNMQFAIVIEKSKNGFGAYVPDLPGCIAAGETIGETETLIKEAISFHLEGMREDGQPVPRASAIAEYVEVQGFAISQVFGESDLPKSACFSTSVARSTSSSSTCTR
jgi:predicted RNase H-like HicB family nuclease/predicted RNA binding protein YcfA (HicA-like mRNA interferase family)